MPCYLCKMSPPSEDEFNRWVESGFTGDFEKYIECKSDIGDGYFWMCGKLKLPPCADCLDIGNFLCDYPVGDGKTCDRSMCASHAHEIAPEIHYCDGHYEMWKQFRDAGGVSEVLKNVIAFQREK